MPHRIVVVVAQQHDAIGHALQDALVLHQAGDIDDFGKMIGVRVDAHVLAAAEMREGANGRDVDDLNFFAKPLTKGDLSVVRSA